MPEADGIYPISEAILCLSLGELYKGCAYKLVAAMITPENMKFNESEHSLYHWSF